MGICTTIMTEYWRHMAVSERKLKISSPSSQLPPPSPSTFVYGRTKSESSKCFPTNWYRFPATSALSMPHTPYFTWTPSGRSVSVTFRNPPVLKTPPKELTLAGKWFWSRLQEETSLLRISSARRSRAYSCRLERTKKVRNRWRLYFQRSNILLEKWNSHVKLQRFGSLV